MRNLFIAAIAMAMVTLVSSGPTAAQTQYDQQDDARCTNYGATPGTDAYVNCRLQLSQMRQQAIQQLLNRPAYVSPYTPVPVLTLQTPHSSNCITNFVGSYAYTNCN
jgi:hypothetical protein